MPDHVHLIIHFQKSGYDIGEALKAIQLPVSRKALAYLRSESPERLPRLAQRRGRRTEFHFWQTGGGSDRNITEPRTLEKMIEYLHLCISILSEQDLLKGRSTGNGHQHGLLTRRWADWIWTRSPLTGL